MFCSWKGEEGKLSAHKLYNIQKIKYRKTYVHEIITKKCKGLVHLKINDYSTLLCFLLSHPNSCNKNFLIYNKFLLPNSYSRVLCLFNYDDLVDKFVAVKKMDIVLPYLNSLSLPSVLEFTIIDAEQKLVKFKDKNQLFISLNLKV